MIYMIYYISDHSIFGPYPRAFVICSEKSRISVSVKKFDCTL